LAMKATLYIDWPEICGKTGNHDGVYLK